MTGESAVVAVFALVYLGMALGRWPGLALDRTGVALVGAIFLVGLGLMPTERVAHHIELPTLVILFALMVLSAQVAASGAFDRLAASIATAQVGPFLLLALVVMASGVLSALLTNDVVVWAMTPLLVRGLVARGLPPEPYVIALAMAANAGSAATVVGNPQNLLIAQAGGLDFWTFLATAGVPAGLALGVVFLTVAAVWGRRLRQAAPGDTDLEVPPIDRAHLTKAALAAGGVVLVFTLPVERALWALAIAGALLISRRLATRTMLGLVDWHLLLLFASLFVVTGTLAETALVTDALARATARGFDATASTTLLPLALAGSNVIGNVPLVTLLLALDLGFTEASLLRLAVYSTLAGNLLIVGSLANIIAVERAAGLGVRIGFLTFAAVGVPATLATLALAAWWLG
ncbi:MAG: anion transporter [Geminicoccaceae bacterium]|nr:MAG: anion transporter [Geminicoccaceae bacterium]